MTFVSVKFGHSHHSRYTNKVVSQLTNELHHESSFVQLLKHIRVSLKTYTLWEISETL